jgi:hypothetical protein
MERTALRVSELIGFATYILVWISGSTLAHCRFKSEVWEST